MSEPHPAPYRISIANRQELVPVDFGGIRRIVQMVLQGEGCRRAKLSFALIDDPAIHELNKRYLQHDYPTDVLTFPFENGKNGLEGEIVISTETAIRNAADYETTPERELLLYVVHGVLHLLEYDDLDEADAETMREREEHYLSEFDRSAGSVEARLPRPAPPPSRSPRGPQRRDRPRRPRP